MKNPWMSLWLSGANAMMGSAVGQATSLGKRQMTVLSTKAAEDMMNLWLTPWSPPSTRQRKKVR